MIERETGDRPALGKDRVVAALKALEPELRMRGVASLALFGSLVRGKAQPDSDIDVLVEIDPAANFDLFDLVGIRNLIGDQLGHRIDLVERASLKPLVRDDVLAEAETVF
jgi:predicted nucleotidyltransferase